MRLKEAMMTVVVVAFILTATRQAAAQSTAGAGAGKPGYELIDLTREDGMAASSTLPFAVDSGVVMSNYLRESPAVQSAGFDTPQLIGTQNYGAGGLGAPVPEPASVAMLVAGLAAFAVAARGRMMHAE